MPKRKDIKKVLVIGSGPDRHRTGRRVRLCGYAGVPRAQGGGVRGDPRRTPTPLTIMTDTHIADKVYMEPLTLEYVAKIIRFERPDAIVPGLGGQTGLNLAVQLAKKGILKECQVEILGTSFESASSSAEDRELFKELCESAGRTGAAVAYRQRRSRRPSPPPSGSAIRWCCVRPSRWAVRAAASPTTASELRGADAQRPDPLARAPGARREEHQGV